MEHCPATVIVIKINTVSAPKLDNFILGTKVAVIAR